MTKKYQVKQMTETVNSAHPFYIQFYPTLSCNPAFGFCFNRKLKTAGDMTVIDFKKIVSVLSWFM